MARKLVEDCRKVDTRNLPKTGLRTVLRWTDPAGELAARAVLEVEGEVVRLAYR